jgi:hypothetical protein
LEVGESALCGTYYGSRAALQFVFNGPDAVLQRLWAVNDDMYHRPDAPLA